MGVDYARLSRLGIYIKFQCHDRFGYSYLEIRLQLGDKRLSSLYGSWHDALVTCWIVDLTLAPYHTDLVGRLLGCSHDTATDTHRSREQGRSCSVLVAIWLYTTILQYFIH